MQQLVHIQNLLKYSEAWKVLFLTFGLFGFYLSILVIGFRRDRNILLGLYTVSISILLLYLSAHLYAMPRLNDALDFAGLVSLFLIGPFSYHLFRSNGKNLKTMDFFLQLLPAMIVVVLSRLEDLHFYWFYLPGLIHVGLYLSWQFIQVDHPSWKKRYTLVQMIVFVGISICCLTCPAVIVCFVSSICLLILILLIWTRLLYTAFISYLIK